MRDCSRRSRQGEVGYESCAISVHDRLRGFVDDEYWLQAEKYLHMFLLRKAKRPIISTDGA